MSRSMFAVPAPRTPSLQGCAMRGSPRWGTGVSRIAQLASTARRSPMPRSSPCLSNTRATCGSAAARRVTTDGVGRSRKRYRAHPAHLDPATRGRCRAQASVACPIALIKRDAGNQHRGEHSALWAGPRVPWPLGHAQDARTHWTFLRGFGQLHGSRGSA